LCTAAVEDLIARYAASLEDVDMIIVSTATPDFPFPSVSSQIQKRFNIPQVGAIDLNATCAGFVYGLQMACGLISSGMYHKVLLIGGDTLSKITDYTDRSTCILFGDGAGAVLIERSHEPHFLAVHSSSDGHGGINVYCSGLSTQLDGQPLLGDGHFVQNGREVYRFAVSQVPIGINTLLHKSGLSLEQVDWFIPHSANLRIIESICSKLNYAMEQTLYSLENYGNTSSATIPLAIDQALKSGHIRAGQTLLLYGFGGGLVQAGILLKWGQLTHSSISS
jgi:3-oxoacyl-[acyl-carrier-protein] synthase-3